MAQVPPGGQDPNALIWIDLEMSGLDTQSDRILEAATIVTDSELNTLAETAKTRHFVFGLCRFSSLLATRY